MHYIRLAGYALFASVLWVCAARGDPVEKELRPDTSHGIARAVSLLPGVTMTPRQYAQYRDQFEKSESAASSMKVLAAAATDGEEPQTAPLLPPFSIDTGETYVEAIAVGDVTADARADIIAFGPQPSPNQSLEQLTVYAQTAEGALDAPIHSPVVSQLHGRPDGFVATPVRGARSDIVAWNGYWIEIYSVAVDGTVAPTPLTIEPGFGILDVAIRDLNADGRPDLVVSGVDRVRRYSQTAGGAFGASVDVLTGGGTDGMLADIDGDGRLDTIDRVVGKSFGFAYRPGLADGTFGPAVDVLETASAARTVTDPFVRDMDGNGLPDVAFATGDGARVRFQTAPGTFTTVDLPASTPTLSNLRHISIGDLDGNGLSDAILWIDGYNSFHVALQTAPRVFKAAGLYRVPDGGRLYGSFYEATTLIADLNGDAKADLLAVTSDLVAFYNSTGSYPVLDASVTSTSQADDVDPTAYVLWQHTVTNAGPATLVDGLLLQNLPENYELSGTDAPCAYFVTLVACALPPVPAGSSVTVRIEAASVLARERDSRLLAQVAVSVGGQPIDTAPDNNATEVITPVLGHPEDLQAAGDDSYVYENAGDAVIPVGNSPGTSLLYRCMLYGLSGSNAPDDTGIADATSGTVCTAPGEQGQSRIRLELRDGATANPDLRFNIGFGRGGISGPGPQRLTIVDDDGGDPKLASAGAHPFEEWPAIFSSVATLSSRSGGDTAAPRGVAIGDLDGDGRNDLAVSFSDVGVHPAYVLVWLQQPNGTLSETPLKWSGSYGGAIVSLAIGDLLGDRAPELVVPLSTELDFLRVVNGELQAVSATSLNAWQVAVSDLDGDGYQDLVVADDAIQSFDGPQYWVPNVTVFHGNAQRTLDPAPYKFGMPYAGRNELVIGRFNDDALPDIAISSGQGNFPSVGIAYQNPDGTFAAPVGVWIGGPMHLDGVGFGDSVTTGDFNGDAKTDLAIGSYVGEGLPTVWIYTDLRDDDFSSPSQRLYIGAEGSLGALDLNGEGRDDLLVDTSGIPGFPGTPMAVFMQDALRQLHYAGNLAQEGSGQNDRWTQKIAVGDLDGDARADAVLVNYYSGRVFLGHSAAANQTVQFTTLESSSQVTTGARARYRVRLTNNGARTSLEIPLRWSLPPQLASPQIVAAKGGCDVVSSTAQCLLPQIDSGGYVDVMLTGTFNVSGTYPMSVSAGPNGAYGGVALTATVADASGGGSSGTGGSSGGSGGSTGGGGTSSSGGGGGALDWLCVCALLGTALGRRCTPRVVGRDRRPQV